MKIAKNFFFLVLIYSPSFSQLIKEFKTDKFVDSAYIKVNRKVIISENTIKVEDFYFKTEQLEEVYQLNDDPTKNNATFKVGRSDSFYPDGIKKQIKYFNAQGQYTGKHISYNNNGDLESIKYYSNDNLVKHISYNKNGVIIETIIYDLANKTDSVYSYYGEKTLKSLTIARENLIKNETIKENILWDYYDEKGTHQVKNGNGTFELKNLTGKTIEKGTYTNGLKTGNWAGYWEEKKANYIESYENGILQKGELIDSSGKVIKYKVLETEATFKGGINQLYMFIGNTMKYPQEAYRSNISGKVVSQFYIETDGSISTIQTTKNVHPSLDEEAKRVLLETSKKWTPTFKRGIPVRTLYTMPINFKLG